MPKIGLIGYTNYNMKLKITLGILLLFCAKSFSQNTEIDSLHQMEAIREKKKNILFNSYLNLEHNYFPINKNGTVNQEIYNWDKIASDWLNWLEKTNN